MLRAIRGLLLICRPLFMSNSQKKEAVGAAVDQSGAPPGFKVIKEGQARILQKAKDAFYNEAQVSGVGSDSPTTLFAPSAAARGKRVPPTFISLTRAGHEPGPLDRSAPSLPPDPRGREGLGEAGQEGRAAAAGKAAAPRQGGAFSSSKRYSWRGGGVRCGLHVGCRWAPCG